jgi:hypothetical protein
MREAGNQPLLGGSLPARITELERKILIAFCTGALGRPAWEKLAGALADHVWHEPEHRVVFAALRQIRRHDPRTWREQLPAQATRMGFPDVDWATYLAPRKKSARASANAQVSKMLRTLKTLAAEQ